MGSTGGYRWNPAGPHVREVDGQMSLSIEGVARWLYGLTNAEMVNTPPDKKVRIKSYQRRVRAHLEVLGRSESVIWEALRRSVDLRRLEQARMLSDGLGITNAILDGPPAS